MIKGSIQQEDLIFVIVYVRKSFKIYESKTQRRKKVLGKFTIMVRVFFKHQSLSDMQNKQAKNQAECRRLEQHCQSFESIIIYRALTPTTEEYTFFFKCIYIDKNCSLEQIILNYQTSLNIFQKMKVLQGIFSDDHEIALEISNNERFRKFQNVLKLSNILLITHGSKKKSQGVLDNF